MTGIERRHPRFLVVEDNKLVNRSLVSLLQHEGYDPIAFETGEPALKYLQGARPDIAMIDIHLPDISGLDIAQELRRLHGDDLPVIIFSGDTSIETLRLLPKVGATYFFSKPVNAAYLLDSLKGWTTGAKA